MLGAFLEVEMSKNCTPLWREAHLQVKSAKARRVRSTFGRQVHAGVARSKFGSKNVQNTPFSNHFWKLRCRKKCTPLWREAHLKVERLKAPGVRATF